MLRWRPDLTVVRAQPVAESVVANCDGDGVGGDLVGDLGGVFYHRLDNGDVGHGSHRGTDQSGGGKACVGESTVGESTVSKNLWVGLGGGQGQGRGDLTVQITALYAIVICVLVICRSHGEKKH